MVSPKPVSTLSKWISMMGIFLASGNWRATIQGIYVLRPSGIDLLCRAAHWESASQGASTTGTPISLSSFLASSFISGVTLAVLLLSFLIALSPSSSAIPFAVNRQKKHL
eukprot:TRINITY_DN9229_c0_g1_i3.p1 TRINITY_DN9229_c0_g1~~TRINITY_DN9229_c0_g1_i3.p1  ORF type:complete len:110 (+),score=14.05 TRINITY_DN9229_c0_g1_i3:2-331(+)